LGGLLLLVEWGRLLGRLHSGCQPTLINTRGSGDMYPIESKGSGKDLASVVISSKSASRLKWDCKILKASLLASFPRSSGWVG